MTRRSRAAPPKADPDKEAELAAQLRRLARLETGDDETARVYQECLAASKGPERPTTRAGTLR